MERTSLRRSLAAITITGFVFTGTACGGATETGLEQLIESQGGGDVDLDLNGDGGFSMQTEEGGMSIDEDGNLVITDTNGSVLTGNIDAESGDVNIQSEDGSFSSGTASELPDTWPGDIPEPGGLSITSASVIGSDTEQAFFVSGSADDGFANSYGAALVSAGFNEDSTFTSNSTVNNSYSNSAWTVGVFYDGNASENQATISVYSTS